MEHVFIIIINVSPHFITSSAYIFSTESYKISADFMDLGNKENKNDLSQEYNEKKWKNYIWTYINVSDCGFTWLLHFNSVTCIIYLTFIMLIDNNLKSHIP